MSKYTEDDLKKELETKEYEYGFYTDIESDTLPVGLNEEIIVAISKKKEEPEWMTDWRLDAFKKWKEMKEPEWANVKYEKPDLQKISYYSAPSNKPKYNSLDEVDFHFCLVLNNPLDNSHNFLYLLPLMFFRIGLFQPH